MKKWLCKQGLNTFFFFKTRTIYSLAVTKSGVLLLTFDCNVNTPKELVFINTGAVYFWLQSSDSAYSSNGLRVMMHRTACSVSGKACGRISRMD